MSVLVLIGLAMVVAAGAGCVDYAHARYVRTLQEPVGTPGRRHRAARWSLAGWLAMAVGFVAVVKFSLWLLPAEGLGYYIGTYLGSGSPNGTRLVK